MGLRKNVYVFLYRKFIEFSLINVRKAVLSIKNYIMPQAKVIS